MNYHIDKSNSSNRILRSASIIKQNSLILESEPLVTSIFSNVRSIYCEYCLKKSLSNSLLKCSQCQTVYYCSEACQKNDWKKSHKQECKLLSFIKIKGYVMTSFFQLFLRVYQGDYLQINEFQSNIQFFSSEKIAFIKDVISVIEVYNEVINIKLIKRENILEIGCKIMVNSFTIQDPITGVDIAIGLYYPSNFINHSCKPNALQVYIGRTMRLIALEEISKDEEINISYLDRVNLDKRIDFLKENYFFECSCVNCITKPNKNINEMNNLLQSQKEYKERICIFEKIIENKEYIESFYAEKAFQDIILESLSLKEFEKAYVLLKKSVKCWNKWFKYTLPGLGWKYAELSKIAFYLSKKKKSYIFADKALNILNIYYKKSDNLLEIEELERNIKEISIGKPDF